MDLVYLHSSNVDKMIRFKWFKTLWKPGFNEHILIRPICMEMNKLILRDTVTEDLELIYCDCQTAQKSH